MVQDAVKIPLVKKQKTLDYIAKYPGRGFASIHHNFPAFKYPSYKKVWEDQIKAGGTEEEILAEIEKFTYAQFKDARTLCKPVHDVDLQRWAVQKSLDFEYKRFKASTKWIQNFKRRNGIVSRKIQKVVSAREVTDEKLLKKEAEDFRYTVQNISPNYSQTMVWNSDQVGFNYEIIDNRTLSWKGEKRTFGCGFSPKNKASHSYTVQYVISMDGSIIGPAYVCLQELGGKMGTKVQQNVFLAPNLLVSCSSSGKLTKSHVKYYVNKMLMPAAQEGTLCYVNR